MPEPVTVLLALFYLIGPFVGFVAVLAFDERKLLLAFAAVVATEAAFDLGSGLPLSLTTGLILLRVSYLLPSILAFSSKQPDRWLVLLFNVLTGATVILWAVAFVWALWPQPKSGPKLD